MGRLTLIQTLIRNWKLILSGLGLFLLLIASVLAYVFYRHSEEMEEQNHALSAKLQSAVDDLQNYQREMAEAEQFYIQRDSRQLEQMDRIKRLLARRSKRNADNSIAGDDPFLSELNGLFPGASGNQAGFANASTVSR